MKLLLPLFSCFITISSFLPFAFCEDNQILYPQTQIITTTNMAVMGNDAGVKKVVRDPLVNTTGQPNPSRVSYKKGVLKMSGRYLLLDYYKSPVAHYPFILPGKRVRVCYSMYPLSGGTDLDKIYNKDRQDNLRGIFFGLKMPVTNKRKNKTYIGGIEFFRRESDTKTERRVLLSCSDSHFTFRFEALPFASDLWDDRYYINETGDVVKACRAFLNAIDEQIPKMNKGEKFPYSLDGSASIYGFSADQTLYSVQIPVSQLEKTSNEFHSIAAKADDVIKAFLEMKNCFTTMFGKKPEKETEEQPKEAKSSGKRQANGDKSSKDITNKTDAGQTAIGLPEYGKSRSLD